MSLQLTKIKGIPIRIHFTLIIAFFLITWTLASGFMPTFFPFLDELDYWLMGIIGALILFISVLLHELAHSILSLRYGIQVKQILLFVFGGVSDIPEETKDYRKEFKIAVVGPVASFFLAGIFAVGWLIFIQIAGQAAAPFLTNMSEHIARSEFMIYGNAIERLGIGFVISRMVAGILLYGAIVNALLGAFNLLPAFPLDGGRILRAAIVKWKRNYDEATSIATKAGIAISYGLMAFGFITILTNSLIGGFWLFLLGWFLQSGAQTYKQQNELAHALTGVRIKDIMNTKFVTVKPNIPLKKLFIDYFNIYRKSEFPVTDEQGCLLGAISTKEAMSVPERSTDDILVEQIMIMRNNLIVMSPISYADDALRRMYKENKGRVFVCDNDNVTDKPLLAAKQECFKLTGIVSKTDLFNVAAERREYEKFIKRGK